MMPRWHLLPCQRWQSTIGRSQTVKLRGWPSDPGWGRGFRIPGPLHISGTALPGTLW